MSRDQVEAELARDPFVPLRIHLSNGKKIKVPFREVAVVMGPRYMVVFIGAKRGTHLAKGHTTVDFESIVRIEQLRSGRGRLRRRKAS
jgi:hypothetical protein